MEILHKLGLTNNEIKIYTALGKMRKGKMSEIVLKSGVPSSHFYPALNALISNGLISFELTGKRKMYKLTSKDALREILESKKEEVSKWENELESALPSIFSNFNVSDDESEIKIYEGVAGIKSAIMKMLEILSKEDTYYVLGAPVLINDRLNGFFRDIHNKRIKKGIKYRIIYNKEAEEFARERSKQKLTEVRVQKLNNSVEIAIYKDIIQFVFLGKKYRLIEIKNSFLANTFLSYFEILWAQSNKM